MAFPDEGGVKSECQKCQALLQTFLAMVLLIKTSNSPRALHLACTKGRRTLLLVAVITVITVAFNALSSLSRCCPRGRGSAAACHKYHSEGRRGFGEDSRWTRVEGQQQQIINVPAVQLEWIFFCFSVFDILVPYPIPVILKKLQIQERFFFLLSLPKRGPFSIFPLHID